MDLIIGGAYQGKLRYAMERFHLAPEELSYYDHGFDTSRRCICYLEQAVWAAVEAGEPFVLPKLRPDAVVLCTDVSCGVVPVGFCTTVLHPVNITAAMLMHSANAKAFFFMAYFPP